MADLKYEQYVTRDVIKVNKWGGEGIGIRAVPEGLIPPEADMTLAVTSVRKPYMFHEPVHKHTFTEYFFFFGSNPMDLHEFDAEVEFSFGEEREKYVITSPTVIIVPPDVYHCPLNFARIYKPIYCLEAFTIPKYSGTNSSETPTDVKKGELKYKKYVIRDAIKENKWGGEGIGLGQLADDLVPPEAKMSLGVTVVRKPYMFHEPVHKHTFTEFFFFFGSNPMDMHEFDAEVEFSIGEEKEKQIITTPAIVTLPPEVYHCPLNYAKVWQPFFCLEAFRTDKYTSTNL
jgi:hypothetical protein